MILPSVFAGWAPSLFMVISVPGANWEKSTRMSARSVIPSATELTVCGCGRYPPSVPISVNGTGWEVPPEIGGCWLIEMWNTVVLAVATIRNRYCWRLTLRFGHTTPLTMLVSELSPGCQYAFLMLTLDRGKFISPSVKNDLEAIESGISNSPLGSDELG
jgi:hypothetical protein